MLLHTLIINEQERVMLIDALTKGASRHEFLCPVQTDEPGSGQARERRPCHEPFTPQA